jgi:hypothetical protein
MRDRHTGDDALWAQRTPHYQRERLTDLHLKYHHTVPNPPKLNKASRRFECGDKTCGPGFKTVDELERHYAATHAKPASPA